MDSATHPWTGYDPGPFPSVDEYRTKSETYEEVRKMAARAIARACPGWSITITDESYTGLCIRCGAEVTVNRVEYHREHRSSPVPYFKEQMQQHPCKVRAIA